jgi:putative zinc finger/helix-turn-helix YgiT family protein
MFMPPEEPNRVKKPRNSDRPFPWHCQRCGQERIVPTRIDYPMEVNYDGRIVAFIAKGIEIPICQNCGDKRFTLEVDDQINAALCAHLGLLTPEQIREGIERLGLTQKEVAERLGIAEATLSRWVNKVVIQSRAMDNYLRMFFQFPEVRTALAAVSMDAAASAVTMPDAV